MTEQERYDRGVAIRTEVVGAERVRTTTSSDFAAPLQSLVTSFAWGDVWSPDSLGRRERSIATVAMLIALNRGSELKVHAAGALANGGMSDELREIMIHAPVYCGFPATIEARKVLAEIFEVKQGALEDLSDTHYFHGEGEFDPKLHLQVGHLAVHHRRRN